ncbi:extracellular solute-binding protein [Nordella sp. HKS 07]|uniref:ABC transporter substrate-binding protein n=1 Tax=Nordella sp. HKS 07 TaxID=2712222 RepID=UPI0013E0FC63|nr:extracellular solute-binding protein [Nordella sp. HKS 07]QIG46966.1 extracellular solute-binding protein [Nordella sp. HKS 07]
MSDNGIIGIRQVARVSRRQMLAVMAGGTAALASFRSAAAAGKDKVTMFGWDGYQAGLMATSNLADQNIELAFAAMNNNDEIITRLASGGGDIDLITPYMGYVPLLAAAGLIQPIDDALVPNLQKVSELFRDDRNILIDGKRYAVPFTWGSGAMIYDPAVIKSAPTSWLDVLKPEYAGKVGMADDPLGNLLLAAMLTTDAEVPTRLTREQLDKAIAFLVKLKKEHVRQIAVSFGELADALARNEVRITFSGGEFIKKYAADKGKTVEFTYPKEGTFAWLDVCALSATSRNTAAAHKVLNEMIETKSQLALAKETVQGICNQDAIAALDPSLKIYPYDNLADFGSKAKFYQMPPLEAADGIMTWTDWQEAYEGFKAA